MRRLIGGIAAFVAVVATATVAGGTAFAAFSATRPGNLTFADGSNTTSPSASEIPPTPITQGQTGLGVGFTFAVPNKWAVGDQLTFTLQNHGDTADATQNCSSSANVVSFVTPPTITLGTPSNFTAADPLTTSIAPAHAPGVTDTSGATTAPSYLVALASSPWCAGLATDEFIVTFTNHSTGPAGDYYSFKVGNPSIAVSSSATLGDLTLDVIAGNAGAAGHPGFALSPVFPDVDGTGVYPPTSAGTLPRVVVNNSVITAATVVAPLPTSPPEGTPATASPLRISASGAATAAFQAWDYSTIPAAVDPANVAIANACNGGNPITAPTWTTYAPTVTRTIVASNDSWWGFGLGSFNSPFDAGVAIVDAAGNVLDCETAIGTSQAGPVTVQAGSTVYVVQFLVNYVPLGDAQDCYPAPPGCDPPGDQWFESMAVNPAAPTVPLNDDQAKAVLITSLPFTQTIDTTRLTSQPNTVTTDYATADDQSFMAPDNPIESGCYEPDAGVLPMVHTAWWTFTPSTTGPLDVRINGRSMKTPDPNNPDPVLPNAIIWKVIQSGPELIDSCVGPYPPTFQAGTTYLIEVGDLGDPSDEAGPAVETGLVPPSHLTLSLIGNLTLAKPDLVVTAVSASPSAPLAGQPVRFTATIKNQGTAATPGGVIHGIAFKIDGHEVTFSDTWDASLPPGASVTLTANGGIPGASDGSWAATAGSHTLEADVDDINRIPNESNENNNTLSVPLTVGPGTQPDLVVTSVTASPAHPMPGDAVRFTAVVKNQGAVATPAGVIVGVAFDVDGHEKTYSDQFTGPLAAGASVTLSANGGIPAFADGLWTATAGEHPVVAFVDDINRIPNESDEANNKLGIVLTIGQIPPAPDLIVTGISWTPSALVAGADPAQRVQFSATVKNQGTRSTPNGVIIGVAFKVNGHEVTWSDDWTAGLAPGQSVTLAANGGGNIVPAAPGWEILPAGNLVLSAVVDDINRIPGELDEENNTLTTGTVVPPS